jgi:hypothetical protein
LDVPIHAPPTPLPLYPSQKALSTLHVSTHSPSPFTSRHGRARPIRTQIRALAFSPVPHRHWWLFQHMPTPRGRRKEQRGGRRREVEGGAECQTLARAEDAVLIDHVDAATHPTWPRLTTALPRPAPLAFFPATMVSISIVRHAATAADRAPPCHRRSGGTWPPRCSRRGQ